ncbi:uncharacterized protein LOC129372238 [Poeciliopsis prolifica]|uniref:uncharacterized protein LOC129372238 n=1 Tax=Poeciliopsis prolifica TaxID=188132 RepID=UPI0024135A05|nr:uncharacterized protein LOC129372238 [Poeciliopsis prolifica]
MKIERIFFNCPDVPDPMEKVLEGNKLKMFAANLELGLLIDCGALKALEQLGEEETALIHKMIERMTEGLTIPKKFSTTSKKRRRMCSKVLDKLTETHSMSQLKNLLTTKDEQGQELWVMTERTRSWIQAAEKGFLHRMAGLFLIDRVRSSVIREGLRLEPLLLHKPVEVALSTCQDASWSEGRKEERKEGRKDGQKEGKTDGWKEGRKKGRTEGWTD